ncbi:MAG: hypothetical protein C7B43_11250 [Sulfobacillus benefaciens]|uniref:Uncharacterized protein n=1 Tax=Sulfobacillus benefaciens TaxID=453960 RepID=A0A2T2WZV3_9FIRM|nr:MAG: hypothetical protein C7B43_11250 [Sulfobacillus benefaciens]
MTFKKWVKKVYGLFVEDSLLAALSLLALAVVFLISHIGLSRSAGLILFILISVSIVLSVLRA